jgi:hypothetical protein
MIEVDLTGQTADDLEGRAKIPSGWYIAHIHGWHRDKKTGALKVTWTIENDPWKGAEITETHNLPALAMTQEDAVKQKRKLDLFLYRVGLIAKTDMGKRVSVSEDQLIGIQRAVVIKRERNKNKPEEMAEYSNIEYGCYYTLDHREIPVAERIRLGLPLLPGQVPPSAADQGAKVVTPPATSKNSKVTPTQPSMIFDPSEI